MAPEGGKGILVCNGSYCNAGGRGLSTFREFRKQLREQGVEPQWDLQFCGCMGFCQNAPMVVTTPEGTPYHRVSKKDIADIVHSHCVDGVVLERKKLSFHAPDE